MKIFIAKQPIPAMTIAAKDVFAVGVAQETGQGVTFDILARTGNRLARVPLMRVMATGTTDETGARPTPVLGEHRRMGYGIWIAQLSYCIRPNRHLMRMVKFWRDLVAGDPASLMTTSALLFFNVYAHAWFACPQ